MPPRSGLDFVDEYRKERKRWREIAKMLSLSYPADGGEPVVVRGGLCDRWRKPVSKITSDDVYGVISEARRKGIPGMAKLGDGVSDSLGRHLAALMACTPSVPARCPSCRCTRPCTERRAEVPRRAGAAEV